MTTVSSIDAQSTVLDQLRSVGRGRARRGNSFTATSDAEVVSEDEKPRKKSIFAAFASASAAATADRSEDGRYLSIPVLPDADPAVYWSGAQKEFPNMAMLARRYVCSLQCNY